MLRNLLFVGILIVAAVTPILVSKSKSGSFVKGLFSKTKTDKQVGNEEVAGELPKFEVDDQLASLLKPHQPDSHSVAETTIVPISQALRFDITPTFVAKSWPRVSTQLSELNLSGMRVPLVTGMSPQDLHGSISYFFDRSHRLQRISLRGFASDVEPIIQFVKSNFGLYEYGSSGPRIFLSHMGKQPLSLMRVRNAPVLTSKDRSAQQELFIEINAPAKGAHLSSDSTQFLFKMRKANLL